MPTDKLELVDSQLLVLQRQLQHQHLVRSNRTLLGMMLFLIAVVLVLSTLLFSSKEVVSELQYKQTLETASFTNPSLNEEVDLLKSQLIGLISGTIETKLKSLEKNIEHGKPLNALETVKSLKSDLKTLRRYSQPHLIPEKKPEIVPVNTVLLQEVAQLKNLIYLTLGSCGLMFAALTGIWWRGRKQLAIYNPTFLDVKSEALSDLKITES